MTTRPDDYPDWANTLVLSATSGQYNRVKPPAAWRDVEGWQYQEKPPRNYFNWWMYYVGWWCRYLGENAMVRQVRFVAASDASAESKAIASATCDGTNDEVEINAAIAAVAGAGGGVVMLSEGTFQVSAQITLSTPVILQGAGKNATVIQCKSTCAAHFIVISMGAGGPCEINDLAIDGNKAGVGSYGHIGIKSSGGYQAIHRCKVQSLNYNGGLAGSGRGIWLAANDSIVDECIVASNDGTGIYIATAAEDALVTRCLMNANGDYNAEIFAPRSVMSRCRALSSVTYSGIRVGSGAHYAEVVDCESRLNAHHGITVETSDYVRVTGCRVRDNSQATHNTYSGIYLWEGTNACIMHNIVRNAAGSPQMKAGIELANAPNAPTAPIVSLNDIRLGGAGTAVVDPAGALVTLPEWCGSGAATNAQNSWGYANRV